ncbi:hypothetical protein M2277_006512 [Paenibacillus sp. LBL]|uniref:pyruvate-formate lyase-activating enzyme n=1 Tax=unclassified Paenibacillus TaxID=185978 RepID=UPI0024759060|nr:pyruvate-formate lyase-activating enzyme [Paenibacillus sp. LBL]MDH6675791.1 hypothetical protein [Paenibacillus sp. LBL]
MMNRDQLLKSHGLDIMIDNGKRPDSDYNGRYHHLNVNWKPFVNDRDLMTNLIFDALDCVGIEERRDFFVQMAWRIIDGGDALERLLSAAFGQQEIAKC